MSEIILALAALVLITWGVGAILAPRRPAKPVASTTMSYRGRHTKLGGYVRAPARWRGHQGGGA
jgi:hypothetical protein